jgi:hypothetical protein
MFANARTRTITEFEQDSNNPSRGLIREAWLRLHGFLVPVYAGGDVDPGGQFFGDGPALQNFVGAANPASTTVVYRNGDVPTIAQAIADGPETDPARRIFADRLRRRSPM